MEQQTITRIIYVCEKCQKESEEKPACLEIQDILESITQEIEDDSEQEPDEISNMFDKLSESELEDLNNTIDTYVQEYIENNLVNYSKGKFEVELSTSVSYLLYEPLFESDILNEDDYDDLYEYVMDVCKQTLENMEIPVYCQSQIDGELDTKIDKEFIEKLHNVKFRKPRSANVQDESTEDAHVVEIKQRSNEWYEIRHHILTASNLWKIFSTESQQNSLIYEKCSPYVPRNYDSMPVNTSSPLHWGVKYEPLTVMVYEKMNDTIIDEFGCIQHPIYDFIGASPDGINVKEGPLYGRMLEIKNIVNREIIGVPSEAYWIQMQLQMECCNIDVCDFVETRFKEYENEEEFYQEEDLEKQRGIILHYIDKTLEKSHIPHYVYMPLTVELEKESITSYIKTKNEELKEEYILYETKYWYLDEYSCVSVQRNRLWFQEALVKIQDFWALIVKERAEGYEHRAPKKKPKQIASSPIQTVIKLDTEPLCDVVLDDAI